MEEMKNLKDLLKHQLEDLYSAEEQIIEALPKMIKNAGNEDLKNSLEDHLAVTEEQKARLDEIKELIGEEAGEEDKGFFASLFSGESSHHCVAMEGLIKEGEKTMNEDMEPEVLDAAIIGACQKIEHYEISGYGTARAYAMHLGMRQVADLLNQTLQEEYEADLLLTDLAVGEINLEATGGESEEEEGVSGLKKLPAGRSKEKSAGSTRSSSKNSNGRGSSNGKSASKSSSKARSGNRTAKKTSSSRSSSRAKAGSSRNKGGSKRRGR